MKPVNFQIQQNAAESLRIQEDQGAYFYDSIHIHPEVQITLILEGWGTRCIGSHFSPFRPGDVMVIGSNLPHVLRCSEEFYQVDSEVRAHAVMFFIPPNFFGSEFIEKPEMQGIKTLLQRADRGVDILGDSRKHVTELIQQARPAKGLDKIISLFSILKALSLAEDWAYISEPSYAKRLPEKSQDRLNRVMDFILANFQQHISLEQVSGVANMVPSAFCRYFKRRTGKTFVKFLNEVRIGHAIRLLVEEKGVVSEVAYRSGFNNLSNFHRQFKEIKGMTPSQFLLQYHGKASSS